mmetsp:Transcript_13043/g.22308  ORF Transcript_13043/g.22308 Transcript_13043/m.22308 type:complete len:245 (+) Transcript_13043:1560-2294(+)
MCLPRHTRSCWSVVVAAGNVGGDAARGGTRDDVCDRCTTSHADKRYAGAGRQLHERSARKRDTTRLAGAVVRFQHWRHDIDARASVAALTQRRQHLSGRARGSSARRRRRAGRRHKRQRRWRAACARQHWHQLGQRLARRLCTTRRARYQRGRRRFAHLERQTPRRPCAYRLAFAAEQNDRAARRHVVGRERAAWRRRRERQRLGKVVACVFVLVILCRAVEAGRTARLVARVDRRRRVRAQIG